MGLPRRMIVEDYSSRYRIPVLYISADLTICQCTKCDVLIFYTDPYIIADAEALLGRINRRNATRRMNLPAPQLEPFVPRPMPIQPKAGDQCLKDGCSRGQNKSCTFSLCKACCDNRPAGGKTCLTHRLGSKGSRAHPPPTATLRLPTTLIPLSQSHPHDATPQPQPRPLDSPDVQPPPTPSDPTDTTSPSPLERSRDTRPGLLPRSNPALSGVETSRRRAELSQASRNSRRVFIWVSVCFRCIYFTPIIGIDKR